MKYTQLTNLTTEDVSKKIGCTIVQTMSRDPLMQRVGVITGTSLWGVGNELCMLEIYWQPCKSMPLGRPYPSSHMIHSLGECYLVA